MAALPAERLPTITFNSIVDHLGFVFFHINLGGNRSFNSIVDHPIAAAASPEDLAECVLSIL